MTRTLRWLVFGFGLLVVSIATGSLPAQEASGNGKASKMRSAVEIEQALDRDVQLQFAETPLQEVVEYLRQETGIPILIDRRALDDAGISLDSPMTADLSEISVRSALRLLLDDLHLTYQVQDGLLQITSLDEADSKLVTRVYSVGDLDDAEADRSDYRHLTRAITDLIAPDSWNEVGGAGTIVAYNGRLVISQTSPVHEQIQQLLASIRQVQQVQQQAKTPVGTVVVVGANAREEKIRVALGSWSQADFVDVPLRDVLEFLADFHKIPIHVDRRSLEDLGVSLDDPVTLTVNGVSLASVLDLVLGKRDIGWSVQNEVLLVAAQDEIYNRMPLRLYPVGDLVGKRKVVSQKETDQPAAQGPNPKQEATPESRTNQSAITFPRTVLAQLGGFAVGGPRAQLLVGSADFLADDESDVLAEMIRQVIQPESWDAAGGPATIVYLAPIQSLAVRQSDQAHEQIRQLLSDLRRTAQEDGQPATDGRSGNASDLVLVVYQLQQVSAKPIQSEELAQVIQTFIEPTSWGQTGPVRAVGDALVVRQTRSVHRQIVNLLSSFGIAPIPTVVDRRAQAPVWGAGGGGFGGGFHSIPDTPQK